MSKYSNMKPSKFNKPSKAGAYSSRELRYRNRVDNATRPSGMLNNPSKPRENLSLNRQSFITVFFALILVAIIVLTVFASLRGSNANYSFTGFLEYLSQSPTLEFKSLSDFGIVGDWGLFDFLRNFFNLFAKMFGVFSWFGEMVFSVFEWIWFFLRFILIGA